VMALFCHHLKRVLNKHFKHGVNRTSVMFLVQSRLPIQVSFNGVKKHALT